MKSRILITVAILFLFVYTSNGQTQQDSTSRIEHLATQAEESLDVPNYQLVPTENYWTFIKLDTRNGKMWQVHFTVSKDGYQGELILNSRSLVWGEDEEVSGRFTLYPTKNMYNFILLDQIDGRTYQVQWNNEEEKRFVLRIY